MPFALGLQCRVYVPYVLRSLYRIRSLIVQGEFDDFIRLRARTHSQLGRYPESDSRPEELARTVHVE